MTAVTHMNLRAIRSIDGALELLGLLGYRLRKQGIVDRRGGRWLVRA